MFDIGFSELVLIAIVALLVIGPERLPETIRVTTRWMRNIRRSFEQAKRDVEQELGVDEIKRQLHNEEILNALNEAKGDLHETHQALTDLPYNISQTQAANKTAEQNDKNNSSDTTKINITT